MASTEKLELLQQAIQKILAENRNKEEDQLLLSRLLSELELLKEDRIEADEALAENKDLNDVADGEMEQKRETENGGGEEKIVKELKEVKRQNFITHCLLSAMIILTVTWQLSEVSLLLRLKDGLSHPFRSFGSMLTDVIRGRERGSSAADKPNKEEHQMEIPSIPIKIPEFPHMESENNSK